MSSPFQVPSHTPFQWQNSPSTNTPLDSSHIGFMETDLVLFTQQCVLAYDTYAQSQFTHADGSNIPTNVVNTTGAGSALVPTSDGSGSYVWIAAPPPGGSVGGDLSGSLPNPTVATVSGGKTPVTTTTAAGGDLTGTYPSPTLATGAVTSTKIASGAAASNVGSLATDLSGTLPNITVVGLQTRSVSTSAPSSTNHLAWSGSQWGPSAAVGFSVGGDLSGNLPNPTVAQIKGNAVGTAVLAGTRTFLTGTAAVSASTYTVITWSGINFNDLGAWAGGAATRLTAPATGLYLVGAAGEYANPGGITATDYYLNIRLNGSTMIASQYSLGSSNTATTALTVTKLTKLNANDYVEAVGWNNAGVALTNGSNTPAYLWMTRLS